MWGGGDSDTREEGMQGVHSHVRKYVQTCVLEVRKFVLSEDMHLAARPGNWRNLGLLLDRTCGRGVEGFFLTFFGSIWCHFPRNQDDFSPSVKGANFPYAPTTLQKTLILFLVPCPKGAPATVVRACRLHEKDM